MNDQGSFLQKLYRKRISGLENYRNAVWKVLCNNFFNKLISPDAHVLDLGAGWCEFINNVHAAKKYAMDLNPETELHLAGDATFIHQDCSKKWDVQDDSLDIVFSSNFLEHLPNKESVDQTIVEAHRCLKDGGLIICIGPNIKYAPGAYWDFWDHHVPLTEISLAELLELMGFEIQLCIARFLPYSMTKGVTPPIIFLRLYLRFPILWKFVARQFLVVGRKPINSN